MLQIQPFVVLVPTVYVSLSLKHSNAHIHIREKSVCNILEI